MASRRQARGTAQNTGEKKRKMEPAPKWAPEVKRTRFEKKINFEPWIFDFQKRF